MIAFGTGVTVGRFLDRYLRNDLNIRIGTLVREKILRLNQLLTSIHLGSCPNIISSSQFHHRSGIPDSVILGICIPDFLVSLLPLSLYS